MEVLGLGIAAKELFKYNRKAFMFDMKLRQEREFQEQDMRVEQFALYREDVRDLVELTVAKMDLYLVSSALLIDKTMMLICKQSEAFPPEENHVPEWAIALNSLSLASGSFFLLLTLWLAMYASISAQSFGTQLLTQFVRLPTASEEQIARATAEGTQFEAKGVGDLLRVPVLAVPKQRDEPTGGAAGSGDATRLPAQAADGATAPPPGARRSADDEAGAAWSLLPSAMLEHIRLYRKVQLNWQAYDAYARVSLFVGANSLLYACLYWSMGNFLYLEHGRVRDNFFPALATALIFSAIQLTITRLDLRLPKKYMTSISIVVVLSPVTTVLGLLFHADLIHRMEKGDTVKRRRDYMMDFLALMAHSLHALLMALVLRASWPARSGTGDDQTLLPSRFRSTLYLDVFGWLLNPGGPGTGSRRHSRDSASGASPRGPAGSPTASPPPDSDSDASSEHVPSEMRTPQRSRSRLGASPLRQEVNARNRGGIFASWGASFRDMLTQERGQRVPRDREMNLSAGLRRDMRDLMTPDSPSNASRGTSRNSFTRATSTGESYRRGTAREPSASMTQELRFGGAEALSGEVMEHLDDPTNPEASANAGGVPAQRVSRRAPAPGETPWQAFRLGTSVILGLWVLSTLWTLGPLLGITSRWARDPTSATAPERLGPRTRRPHPTDAARPLDDARAAPPARLARRAAADAAGLPLAAAEGRLRVRSGAGDCRVPAASSAGAAVACSASGAPASRRCVLALLRRGGRAVTLCQLRPRGAGAAAAALRVGSLRVAAGAPALQSLAVGWRPGARGSGARGLRVVAWAAGGALLSLRAEGPPPAVAGGALRAAARWALTPEFELDLGGGLPPQQARSRCGGGGELLVIAGELLLSVEPVEEAPAGGIESCSANAGFRVRAWNLLDGEQEIGWLPHQDAWRWSAAEVLQELGASRSAEGPTSGAWRGALS